MEPLSIGESHLAICRALQLYRGRKLERLAQRAGVSRALVYRLRSHEPPNAQVATLEKLQRALRESA